MEMNRAPAKPASSKEDFESGMNALISAIQMHAKHMNGSLPTTGIAGERSQMRMMNLMREAYARIHRSVKR